MRPGEPSRATATAWTPHPIWICRIRSPYRPICSCWRTKPSWVRFSASPTSSAPSFWRSVARASPGSSVSRTGGFR